MASTLVLSSNRGRYALDTPDGADIISGQTIEVYIGGQWVMGTVEHTGHLYASESGRAASGYYFMAANGGICGLCVGMRVRKDSLCSTLSLTEVG